MTEEEFEKRVKNGEKLVILDNLVLDIGGSLMLIQAELIWSITISEETSASSFMDLMLFVEIQMIPRQSPIDTLILT